MRSTTQWAALVARTASTAFIGILLGSMVGAVPYFGLVYLGVLDETSKTFGPFAIGGTIVLLSAVLANKDIQEELAPNAERDAARAQTERDLLRIQQEYRAEQRDQRS